MAASGSKKPGWMSVMLLKERSRDLQKGSVGDRDKIYKIKKLSLTVYYVYYMYYSIIFFLKKL